MVTRLGQLAQEVTAANPWWRSESWAARDPDLLNAERSALDYHPDVLSDLEPGCLYILRGPRRVGKTVAVKQLVQRLISTDTPPTAIVRVAVDGWAAKDLRTLTQHVTLPPGPPSTARYWLIDEVTAVTGDWPAQIKWLRDNDPGFAASTVVLTGSSATGLTEAAGALAGRRGRGVHLDRSLLPMGFRTFARHALGNAAPDVDQLPLAGLKGAAAARAYRELVPWLDDLVRTWELYIGCGGYPVAVAEAVVGRQVPEWFVNDLFDIVAHDAFRTSRLARTTEMALLERLWNTITSFAVPSRIGADLDVSHEVVSRHMDFLSNAYLLWTCPQKDEKAWVAKERTQDKIYAVDPLVARMAHLRNPERHDIDPTALTEMQLGNAVRRRILAEATRTPSDRFLFHARTPTRKEIDFVSEHLGGVAIEGKYTEGAWRSSAATVEASPWSGLLATRNVLDTPTGKDATWAVPAGMLAYVLDS